MLIVFGIALAQVVVGEPAVGAADASGELLTRWTIRLALGCYALSVFLVLTERSDHPRGGRWAWTAGLLAYLAHVACAFHYYHDWSHDAAYATTAAETREVVGLDWGGGLYFNYGFTTLWLIDVLWWWAHPRSRASRPRAIGYALHGFLAFMAFQATVVFEGGPVRWAGLAATALLGTLWLRSGRTKEPPS